MIIQVTCPNCGEVLTVEVVNPNAVSPASSERPPFTGKRSDLREYMRDHFTLEELQVLAAELGIDYQQLRYYNGPKENFALSIITHLEQRRRLHELMAVLRGQ